MQLCDPWALNLAKIVCVFLWEEQRLTSQGYEPKDRLLLQNLMAIRITPDSCPIHTRITHLHTVSHHLPPIPHPGCFGGACRGPLESLVEECICLVCPASNRCCLPTASAQSGPLLEVQLIQQYNFKAANHLRIIPSNHTPESYPESYPRIIPPIQTSRPDYGKKYTHMFHFVIIAIYVSIIVFIRFYQQSFVGGHCVFHAP